MSWSALTEDEVISRFSSTEEALLQRAALASPGLSPLADIITQVTHEVRGYCAVQLGKRGKPLGPSGTLPDQVRGAAVDIIRWKLPSRIAVGSAGSLLQGDSRKKEYDDAMALLKDIAAGKCFVEDPVTAGPEVLPTFEGKFGGDCKLDF